jgi:hypothetical protein
VECGLTSICSQGGTCGISGTLDQVKVVSGTSGKAAISYPNEEVAATSETAAIMVTRRVVAELNFIVIFVVVGWLLVIAIPIL